ncbi:MAG: ABC transporter ATP-binding protein [Bacteroidia bacterium]|nr:ABC transporter ATP-binding protein [Bacteroidia bacterium]
MMEIRGLKKQFGRIHVLNGLTLQLKKGSAYALIGPNGSGKTTMLKILLGLVNPDSGEALFQNKSVLKQWKYRNHFGYMPQISRYPENMTPFQIMEMIKDIRQHSGAYDMDLYKQFGINKFENKAMHSLSGGMRQKVGASLAFMFSPEVIILDEPTAGLDPLSTEILKEKIIRSRHEGKLILITSHILSDLDEIITHVIYLNEGNILFQLTIEELRSRTKSEKLSQAIAAIMKENGHA